MAFLSTAQNTSDFESELLLKNDFSIVSKDNKYGMTNKQRKIVVPLIYDRIETYLFVDYAVVSIIDENDNEKSGIINLKNEVIVPVNYGDLSVNEDDNDRIALIIAKKDNKYGMFNKRGKVLLPVEHEAIDG